MPNHDFKWEEMLVEVSKVIPPQQFRAWVESIQFIEITGKELILAAPTSFMKDWVLDHYKPVFQKVLSEVFGLNIDIRIDISASKLDSPDEPNDYFPFSAVSLKPSEKKEPSKQKNESAFSEPLLEDVSIKETEKPQESNIPVQTEESEQLEIKMELKPPSETTDKLKILSVRDMANPVVKTLGDSLNRELVFETYVVGSSNQFAHAAARAVAEHPATQYNPLFLYSDAGLGKTHLLHAIGNYVLKSNPKARICYLSAEKFVNDLIESIHHGKMQQFREKYRNSYDILLMDDIQFIAGKDRTQEEFFHTFNALHSSRRQIVVTSDKFPKDIPGLEERLRTRFEWGLIADIQPPEIETRIAILRAKANRYDVFLPPEVALFLASNIKSNIRELEGALTRLSAQASFNGSEISLDLAKQVLSDIIHEPTITISPESIFTTTAGHFGLKVADLKGLDRSKRVATARQIAMYLVKKYCFKSYTEIGILFGGRDHSTILHGVKTIERVLEKDSGLKHHIEQIQNNF